MGSGANGRFDAEAVVRVASVTEGGRFEIELRDSRGETRVISLPISAAVDLGCLICDVSEGAPYLVGGIRRTGTSRK
jgi:hypothetical protein